MTLPDERPRASVGNLVARFEKKVVPDAAGSTPAPRPLGVSGGFNSYNGTPPSWMRKKDAVSPPSGSDNAATSTSPAPAPAVFADPPALPISADDPFIAPMPEPAPAPEPAPTIEPLVVPEPEAGSSSDQLTPSVKPKSASTSLTKPTATPSTSKPIPSDSPKRSMINQMVKSTKVPPAPRINAINKTTSVPPSSSVSSLNKAKSTSSLKSGTASTSSARFTAPTAASKARAAADAAPIPAALKPQHTGTSTASTSRRAVVAPSSSKAVPFPARSPSSAPKPRAALFAPTASSLAKSRDVEDPMIRKPNAPPSSYSPRPAGRPRSGSTGSGSTTALKPLHLPTKSSASASGSTRRMVSVPRQPKAEHVKEASQEELLLPSTVDNQTMSQDPAPQPREETYNLSDAPETAGYRLTDDVPQGTKEQSRNHIAYVGPDVEEHSETLDQHPGYVQDNSKWKTEPSEATFIEPQVMRDEQTQYTPEREAEIPDISSDS